MTLSWKSKSSSVISTNGLRKYAPALLISTAIGPSFALDRGHRGDHLIALGNVGRRDERFAAGLMNQVSRFIELRFGACDQSAGVSFARHPERDVAADAAPGARNQCDFRF